MNNGGLRWLQKVAPPIGREMRAQRLRMREVMNLLEGRYYFTHEHHISHLDPSGAEMVTSRGKYASDAWITMQEMVDGFTGIDGTRLPRIFVGNPSDPSASVGAHGGVRWLRGQLAGGS